MMLKRCCSVALCLILVCNMLLMFKIPVHASAYAMPADAETTAEIIYLLYSLIESGAIAAGAYDGLGSYADNESIVDVFNSYVCSVMEPDSFGTTVTLSDGSVLTYKQISDLVSFAYGVDGSSALAEDMTEEETEAYRQAVRDKLQVLNGGSGGDEGDGEEDPEGDPEIPESFSKVKRVVFGSGFMQSMGDFFGHLINGDLTSLRAGDYFDLGDSSNAFDGTYPPAGNHYTGRIRHSPDRDYGRFKTIDVTNTKNCFGWYRWSYRIKYFDLGYINSDGKFTSVWGGGGWDTPELFECYVNFPWFDGDLISWEEVKAAVTNGDFSRAVNYEPPIYDFPGLAESVPETLHPLTGINLNPNALPLLNTRLRTAAHTAAGAEPAKTVQENNAAYMAAVEEAATLAVPDVQAAPEPVPDPYPDPEITPTKEMDTETGGMTADLTMIFPFCLPFDLIRLLRALDADPVCPSFDFPVSIPALGIEEHVTIDLSFLEDAVKIFRIGELGCWIIMLIVATRKMIKW